MGDKGCCLAGFYRPAKRRATRGEHEGGFTFGTLPSGLDVDAILARVLP